ncbi:MAG: hypothetical protein GYA51_05195 [Candidatus Methanofastidiosa archaeon]|jgi:uncharacterized membrane protein (DUF373 family)|nr:hypothetical protein [Candidatus Methanofastidiosa archaeon]
MSGVTNKKIEEKKKLLMRIALITSPPIFLLSIILFHSIGYFIFVEAFIIYIAREIIMKDFLSPEMFMDRLKLELALLILMFIGSIIIFLEWQSKKGF